MEVVVTEEIILEATATMVEEILDIINHVLTWVLHKDTQGAKITRTTTATLTQAVVVAVTLKASPEIAIVAIWATVVKVAITKAVTAVKVVTVVKEVTVARVATALKVAMVAKEAMEAKEVTAVKADMEAKEVTEVKEVMEAKAAMAAKAQVELVLHQPQVLVLELVLVLVPELLAEVVPINLVVTLLTIMLVDITQDIPLTIPVEVDILTSILEAMEDNSTLEDMTLIPHSTLLQDIHKAIPMLLLLPELQLRPVLMPAVHLLT